MDACTYGKLRNDACHKLIYVSEVNLNPVDDSDKREILRSRSGIKELLTLCLHHEYILMERYPAKQTKCCDPFNTHTNQKKRKKSLGKYLRFD